MDQPNTNRYRITHETHYSYSDRVSICRNQLRMMPRAIKNALTEIRCDQAGITIEPEPDVISEHVDYFGNQVVSFSIESPHQELRVTARSELSVIQRKVLSDLNDVPWQSVVDSIDSAKDTHWLSVQEYQTNSDRIRRCDTFAKYATETFRSNASILDASLNLTKRIHRDFDYSTTATDVTTPTEIAFEKRAGVCQDFAHVQIACLRSIGLPARYVSGYLRTEPKPGESRLVGADESHAWISLYAGESIGWIDLDPTNACVAGLDHIPIGIGRDYNEVSPMRGVVLGGGDNKLQVKVDVEPIK